jgi:hypothetical protein
VDAALDLLEEEIVPLTAMPGVAGRRGAKRLILRRFPYDVVVSDHSELAEHLASQTVGCKMEETSANGFHEYALVLH